MGTRGEEVSCFCVRVENFVFGGAEQNSGGDFYAYCLRALGAVSSYQLHGI